MLVFGRVAFFFPCTNIIDYFHTRKLKEFNINVQTGKFGEMMDIKLINNGPVTLIMESKNEKN